jgi:cytoskeletal protein CcmA (bactofilin family)
MSSFNDPKRPSLPPDLSRITSSNAAAKTTVLTNDCEFRGALAFSGELQLHGRLEGTIESEGGTLTVGEEAVVKAEIRVNDVIVYGKIQGNITATGRVELKGKAQVFGDLRTNRLAVEDGVVFVGSSQTLSKTDAPAEFSKLFNKLGLTKPINGAADTRPAKAAVA